jgi:hypothetical protein
MPFCPGLLIKDQAGGKERIAVLRCRESGQDIELSDD